MNDNVEIILASASSRRGELLDQIGIKYKQIVPTIDEKPLRYETPADYVTRIACNKAKAVWMLSAKQLPVLGADTIITLDGSIVGKPLNQQDAENSLKNLSGREHQAVTGLCLWASEGTYDAMVETTVKFRVIKVAEIQAYCSTIEPYDKAGAYAIQGEAGNFVEYISGSYTGVVGLPLKELCVLLYQSGIFKNRSSRKEEYQ